MAPPKLSEDEVDDLVYLARTGNEAELAVMLKELAAREGATSAEVLEAARDDGQATCLHMAAANGHSSKRGLFSCLSLSSSLFATCIC